jgi:hypothetical protein
MACAEFHIYIIVAKHRLVLRSFPSVLSERPVDSALSIKDCLDRIYADISHLLYEYTC